MNKGQRENYIESGGNICPICESADITGGAIMVEQLEAWQSVWCNECDAEWTDIYKIDRVVIDKKESTDPKEVKQ